METTKNLAAIATDTFVAGSHAAPITEGHLASHVISVCQHCGGSIRRNSISSVWFHHQSSDIPCTAESAALR